MCGRFNQYSIVEGGPSPADDAKLSRFRKQEKANISPGMFALIIKQELTEEAEFGFRPVWDIKKLFINARAEGSANDTNQTDNWNIGIDTMPTFKQAFKTQRCIIPVNSFIEGPEKEKLSKPYEIKPIENKELYLGGIYSYYVNPAGEKTCCFAIVTTPAFVICRAIGHHRSPLLLHPEHIQIWLNPQTHPDELKTMIKLNTQQQDLKAIPLHAERIKSGRNHEPEVLEPAGLEIVC